jgi:hypothetical protein
MRGRPPWPREELVDRLARRVVVVAPEALGEDVDDVADPDDADDVLALEHRHVPDAPLPHKPCDGEDVIVGRRRHEPGRHHLVDSQGRQVCASAGEAKDVPFREDADESSILADDDRADVRFEHERDRFLHRVARGHGDNPRAHDVDDRHQSRSIPQRTK